MSTGQSVLSAPPKVNNFGCTAVSSDGIRVGPGLPPGGLHFHPRQTDKCFMIGLGLKSSAPADSRLSVYESGSLKFHSTKYSYSANSLIELRVTEGKVELLLDGEKLGYTGAVQGPSTLNPMADFHDVGAKVVDIQLF